MSDTNGDERRTGHPDTSGSALRRRSFIAAAGATATGMVGAASADRGRGPDRDRSTGADNRGRNRSCEREFADRADEPELIAHRGFAGLYPENTVGAVEAAARGIQSPYAPSRGADMIEIDVVPTADGDVVVFHDDRLAERDDGERGLTDTEGVVWKTDTETVTSAEVLESGETVPRLRETLATIPSHVGVNVELKNPGSFDVRFAESLSSEELATQKEIWQPFVADVLAIVDDFDHEYLFSSFYEAALATTREASDYPVAPLLWDSVEAGVEVARRYEAEAVHPPYDMIRGTPFYADQHYAADAGWDEIDLLAVAHKEGRDVNVFTLETWYQASQLAAASVDGLISDYADVRRFGATN
ncbi:glycerophosphodiester phosphodiesterase (plasmid) [Haloterrigena salifodinae]|uniref:Glycerophosphodiester phosphodiesterase n=1 Tax=Haloterrigena salifodinae TaxID=2675099 RepID=A0A8T8E7R7_9EURY|nr:glycerophosphodiester phosphodiesterase [Haloterrigena salifodinae]QRV17512.1 glycerophosphodiester phosphodiesterase [Haloterrigena salifodinae]